MAALAAKELPFDVIFMDMARLRLLLAYPQTLRGYPLRDPYRPQQERKNQPLHACTHAAADGYPRGALVRHRSSSPAQAMPVCDGVESTRRIRAHERAAGLPRRCHIVALTAHASADDRAECLREGMDYFLCVFLSACACSPTACRVDMCLCLAAAPRALCFLWF